MDGKLAMANEPADVVVIDRAILYEIIEEALEGLPTYDFYVEAVKAAKERIAASQIRGDEGPSIRRPDHEHAL